MTGNIETEFKLRTPRPIEVALVDAAVRESAFVASETSSRRHNDIYLDDAQRSLAGNGIGLRVRVGRTGSTVTCKSRGQRDGAMFVREEREAAWPSPTTPPTAAELPLELRDAVEPIVLRRPLVPVLRLDVTRDLRQLSYDGHDLCELAIDRVQAHGAGRSVQFTEIEIEVASDLPTCEKLAAHLETTLQIQAASNDKPTHASRLLGLATQNGIHDIDPSTSTTAAITSIMRRLLGAAQRTETQVRQGLDEKPVHLMRTTLRRLRAILAAFRKLWPQGEGRWIRAHLRALSAELGRARDLDVMVATLPAEIERLAPALQPAAERAIDWMRRARVRAHEDLVDWLRSPQRLDDAQRFADLMCCFDESQKAAERSIAATTRDCLAAHAARLRRLTKDLDENAPIARFHAARIATKKLRYVVEELGEFVDIDRRKLKKRLTRLQRAIGELCDGDTAVEHLLGWADRIRADCEDEPLVGAALGAIAQRRFDWTCQSRAAAVANIRRERRRLPS